MSFESECCAIAQYAYNDLAESQIITQTQTPSPPRMSLSKRQLAGARVTALLSTSATRRQTFRWLPYPRIAGRYANDSLLGMPVPIHHQTNRRYRG